MKEETQDTNGPTQDLVQTQEAYTTQEALATQEEVAPQEEEKPLTPLEILELYTDIFIKKVGVVGNFEDQDEKRTIDHILSTINLDDPKFMTFSKAAKKFLRSKKNRKIYLDFTIEVFGKSKIKSKMAFYLKTLCLIGGSAFALEVLNLPEIKEFFERYKKLRETILKEQMELRLISNMDSEDERVQLASINTYLKYFQARKIEIEQDEQKKLLLKEFLE